MVPPGHNGNGSTTPRNNNGAPGTSKSWTHGHLLLPHPSDRKLTIKEARFVTEFLKDMDASHGEIATRAGYSKKTAHAIGWQVIRRPLVMAEIQDQLHAFVQRERLSIQRLVRHLIELAEVDKRDFFRDDGSLRPMSELTKTQASLIKGFTTSEIWDAPSSPKRIQIGELKKITLTDHLKPIEMLAKSLQSFVDKVEIEEHRRVDVNVNHNIDVDFKVLNPTELKALKGIYQAARERTREAQAREVTSQ